uniref:Uncharacterized protein n=1 Tax=Anguilla anguilla TaxID=7936 RepID=A0A0E9TVG4_ANGAN
MGSLISLVRSSITHHAISVYTSSNQPCPCRSTAPVGFHSYPNKAYDMQHRDL